VITAAVFLETKLLRVTYQIIAVKPQYSAKALQLQ